MGEDFQCEGVTDQKACKATGVMTHDGCVTGGFGYRLDGEQRDVKWGDKSYMVAAQWTGDVWEEQAHRELAALLEIMEGEDADDLLHTMGC